jgi:hypothetical protein
VREWTGTWDTGKKQVVIKGGAYTASDVTLSQRNLADPSASSETVGFRTVSRTPPTQ